MGVGQQARTGVCDTVWLSIDQMAELFQRDKSTISRHIKNIFTEGELRSEATVAKFATVQMEGGRQVSRNIEYYNLDVIISVGYRVVWIFRAMLASFIEPWPLEPIPAAAIGQLIASDTLAIFMVIMSGILIKEMKRSK